MQEPGEINNSECASSDLDLLRTVPLFVDLSTEEIAGLRAVMDECRYAPGQTIIREGEPGDNFQILVEGQARCVVLDAGGEEIMLDEYSCGGFFGELSMLTGAPRSARVKALDSVTTLALDRDEFFHFLREHPAAAINVLTTLGKRLHRTDSLLRSTVSRNVNEVVEEEMTHGEKVTESIANFSGTLKFLVLHILWIGFWLLWNQPWFPGFDFDPSPYGLLATVLGLEAIFLSILVLVSQNRQEAKDRIAEEIHHQINTKAEVEIGLILRRLDDLERSIHHSSDEQIELLRRAVNGSRSTPARAPESTPESTHKQAKDATTAGS